MAALKHTTQLLLCYHARYYDPNIGRFLSADTVVPGSASGSMDGIALKGLTVDFHELASVVGLSSENRRPFWFQLSDEERQRAGIPWGPMNPQALNRYSYVWNNPLLYDDPTGHNRVEATYVDHYGISHTYGYQEVRGPNGVAKDAQGRVLWEVWSCENGAGARCTVMWVPDGVEFQNYKASVDALAGVDYGGLGGVIAVAGILTCIESIIGCGLAAVGAGVFLWQLRQAKEAADRYSNAAGKAFGIIGYGGADRKGSAIYKCVLDAKCHPGDYDNINL